MRPSIDFECAQARYKSFCLSNKIEGRMRMVSFLLSIFAGILFGLWVIDRLRGDTSNVFLLYAFGVWSTLVFLFIILKVFWYNRLKRKTFKEEFPEEAHFLDMG